MQSIGYYRTDGTNDNLCDLSTPLRINCCGIAAIQVPFSTYSPHGRRDYYFMYMAEGTLNLEVRGKEYLLSAGDLVLIPPETAYRYSLSEGSMAYYWVHFTGSFVPQILENCALKECLPVHPGKDPQALDLLAGLHRSFIMKSLCFDSESAGYFMLTLSRLQRVLSELDGAQSGRLQTSLEYIHRHYAQPLSVQSLSAMEFLSISRYSALFREKMGCSPQQYLITLRMRNACDLIRSTDMPLKQVAAAVGYQDQLYFSRLFRRTQGCSPSEYRDLHK